MVSFGCNLSTALEVRILPPFIRDTLRGQHGREMPDSFHDNQMRQDERFGSGGKAATTGHMANREVYIFVCLLPCVIQFVASRSTDCLTGMDALDRNDEK